MDIYAELGIEPIINAAGTLTSLGGSLMPQDVLEAMRAAAAAFVPMDELHLAAGRRIAALVDVEAAHVCAGAAAGITLMAAACMTGTDTERIHRLPDTEGLPNRFIVQASHHTEYLRGIRMAGGHIVTVPDGDPEALAKAIDERTAAIYYTHAWFCRGKVLPLSQAAQLAHRAGIPLIADVAAELPPVENLPRYAREGADLYVFSGGKALCGPQSTGLILGRRDLVEACRLNDCPHNAVGRGMKTGKEEIVALVKAVERYMNQDHAAQQAIWEERVAYMRDQLAAVPGVHAWRALPYGTGQLIPHVRVTWPEAAFGLRYEEAVEKLLATKPRVAVQFVFPRREVEDSYPQRELRLHPHTLQPGQERIVAEKLRKLLEEKACS